MKIAIFTLTKKALLKGEYLKALMAVDHGSIDLYGLKKWHGLCEFIPYEGKMKETLANCFNSYDAQVYIMATGIVVRTIAPLIKSKDVDPAIIVADENLTNIISLLSGHLGGANSLALTIAKLVGGNPVITTASDVSNSIAVDTFAMDNNLAILSLKEATHVTASIINGENVGVLGLEFKKDYPDNLISIDAVLKKQIKLETRDGMDQAVLEIIAEKQIKAVILVSNKIYSKFSVPWVQLIPRNIVLGIGCKKDMPFQRIKKAFEQAMASNNISGLAVRKIATVDVKEHEMGIIRLSEHLNVDLEIISRDKIALIEDEFVGSDFVKATIGVRAVAEPCAKIAGNKGNFMMKKTAYNGITIALWEETNE